MQDVAWEHPSQRLAGPSPHPRLEHGPSPGTDPLSPLAGSVQPGAQTSLVSSPSLPQAPSHPSIPGPAPATGVGRQLVFGPRASVVRCDGAAGPVWPPNAHPGVRAHSAGGGRLRLAAPADRRRWPRPLHPKFLGSALSHYPGISARWAGPGPYPWRQQNKRELPAPLCVAWGRQRVQDYHPDSRRVRYGRELAGAKFRPRLGGGNHLGAGWGQEIFVVLGKGAPGRAWCGGPGAPRGGPEVH